MGCHIPCQGGRPHRGLEQRQQGTRSPGQKRACASRPWSEREALAAADLSQGPGRPALALTLAHSTGPEQLGEREGPTHEAPPNVGTRPAHEVLGTAAV